MSGALTVVVSPLLGAHRPSVRDDIARQRGRRDPFLFVAPFDRPNLRLDVVACESGEKVARLIEILRADAAAGCTSASRARPPSHRRCGYVRAALQHA